MVILACYLTWCLALSGKLSVAKNLFNHDRRRRPSPSGNPDWPSGAPQPATTQSLTLPEFTRSHIRHPPVASSAPIFWQYAHTKKKTPCMLDTRPPKTSVQPSAPTFALVHARTAKNASKRRVKSRKIEENQEKSKESLRRYGGLRGYSVRVRLGS